MKKAAQSFIKIFFFAAFSACGNGNETEQQQALDNKKIDSLTEASIDSAYRLIRQNCDTSLKYIVPILADSIIKIALADTQKLSDSALMFITKKMMTGSDTANKIQGSVTAKAARIIAVLKADCDANLLKETYTRARLQLQSKQRQQHGKRSRRV